MSLLCCTFECVGVALASQKCLPFLLRPCSLWLIFAACRLFSNLLLWISLFTIFCDLCEGIRPFSTVFDVFSRPKTRSCAGFPRFDIDWISTIWIDTKKRTGKQYLYRGVTCPVAAFSLNGVSFCHWASSRIPTFKSRHWMKVFLVIETIYDKVCLRTYSTALFADTLSRTFYFMHNYFPTTTAQADISEEGAWLCHTNTMIHMIYVAMHAKAVVFTVE